MKKLFAFLIALAALSVSYAFAQEIDPEVPAVQDTVTVTVQGAPVVVEEPVAPEIVPIQEASEAIEEAPSEVQEELPLYTEEPKVDRQIFNHLAAGVPITFPILPQGIGIIEVATTLTPIIQLRLGYTLPVLSVASFTMNQLSGAVPQLEQYKVIDYNGTKINLGESKFSFGTNLGGINFLMDVFPGKKTPFHFTFGFYVNPDSPDNLLEVRADLSSALKEAGFTPGKYNEVYFGFNDDDPTFRVSPNSEGILKVGVRTNPIHPYVGIGFGRAIRPDRRVCVTFDMGAIYWGSPVLVGYDYSLNPSGTAVGFSPER